MSSEEAAASPKNTTDDDGMTWWYRWLCKIAGVLGGICEYITFFSCIMNKTCRHPSCVAAYIVNHPLVCRLGTAVFCARHYCVSCHQNWASFNIWLLNIASVITM